MAFAAEGRRGGDAGGFLCPGSQKRVSTPAASHTGLTSLPCTRSAADVTTGYGCYNSTGHGIHCAAGQPTRHLTARMHNII